MIVPDRECVITTRGLTRRFGSVLAVDRLDLQVYAGEIFGFLGHNGAGKTTAVRLMNGILGPTSGSMEVLGFDPVADGPQLRQYTGVLTETPAVDERLTARENLRLFADMFDVPRSKVAHRVTELLTLFELDDRAEQKVSRFSKGMKQRLALARALLHDPRLIFLDEPTDGLDPVATRHVHRIITHLSHDEHRTIFLCTHNLTEAQALCDRVAVLEHGQLLALGTPRELIQQVGRSQRLEIEVAPDEVEMAKKLIHSYSGISISSGDDNLLVVQGVTYESIPDLVDRLSAAHLHIYRVAQHELSLEDAYFALHYKELNG